MRQYVNVNGVIIPKPLSWQPAPLLMPAFDQPNASIPAFNASDDDRWSREMLDRWRDRDYKPSNWERT